MTPVDLDVIEKITERLEALKQFAEDNREMLESNGHLDEGTPERAYWHAGYASALADIRNLLLGTRKSVN
jgi:hypothetical protein